MAITILMPALSPTMEEGTLASWLVSEGDRVQAGDVIAEIETDKATMEVEAADDGVLAKILVVAGTDGVAVQTPIALIAEEGEDPTSLSVDSLGSPAAEPQKDAQQSDSPAPMAEKPAVHPAPAIHDRVKASPLARRLAALDGINLEDIEGSGPGGRIVKRDIEAAQKTQKAEGAGPAATTPSERKKASGAGTIEVGQTAALDDRLYAPDSYKLVPLDGMRKTVARRLTESFATIPHFPLTIRVSMDDMLALRARLNAAAPDGVKISVNDVLIKAVARALMDEPDVNASFTDAGIAYHHSAHISVAVAIDGGLITPVIRDTQTKGLAQISAEMKDLAARARERALKPEEFMGGTFSVSNLGMMGIESFASIINPPEGAILSVGTSERRLREADTEKGFEAYTSMALTLTCDHRVIGGAEGARWLTSLKAAIEHPETLLL